MCRSAKPSAMGPPQSCATTTIGPVMSERGGRAGVEVVDPFGKGPRLLRRSEYPIPS